jgi:outer membrane protein assembly factor BamB
MEKSFSNKRYFVHWAFKLELETESKRETSELVRSGTNQGYRAQPGNRISMVGKADPSNDRENLALECAFTEGVRRNCIMTTVNWKSIFLATVVTTSIGVSIEDGSTSGLAEGQTAPVGRPVGGNWKRQLLALDKISTSPVNKDPNAVSGVAPLPGSPIRDTSAPLAPGADSTQPSHTGLTGAVSTTGLSTGLDSTTLIGEAETVVKRFTEGWHNFLQNPCHTAVCTAGPAAPPAGRMFWSFPAEGGIDSSPIIDKGVVYIGCDDNYVYALSEKTGKMIWRAKLGDKVKSTAAVGDGFIVIGCEDKKLYKLNSSNGSIIWSVQAEDRISSSPVVLDGAAYVGSWDGFLYKVSLSDGRVLWKVQTGGRITSSPAVLPSLVMVTSHSGTVFALAPADGAILWQYHAGNKLYGSPLILGGTVFFDSWDKNLYAFDLATGKPKWKFTGPETFSISPVGDNGRIYVGNDDLKMYCFDAQTGRVIWKAQLNSPVPLLASAPALCGSCLYVGSADSNLYALDIRNGAIKWKFKAQRPIVSSPSVSRTGICVGSQDGNVYMVN